MKPSILHADRWRELEPEFAAFDHLSRAEEVLTDAVDTAPVANALKAVRGAMAQLHPAVRDPAARDEFAQRKAGTWGGVQAPPTKSAQKLLAEQSATIDRLQARLEKLETERAAEPQRPEA